MNVPPLLGMAVAAGRATWAELSTSLGVEDLHDILEGSRIDAHNARIIDAWNEKTRK